MTAPHLARGARGEELAAEWYRRHGYEVVARNWRCRTPDVVGEIDIVALGPGVVVVCEVKSRAGDGFGGPAAAVDHRKQSRLRRLAVAWLAAHRPGAVQVRFDVATVVGDDLTMIVAAF